MKSWNPLAPTSLPKKQVNTDEGEKKQINKDYSSSSWLLRRIRQCSGNLVLCLSENNREMGRGVFLQVHCGHCPWMRCLICAQTCCCACLWALDMCTAAWIIEALHAVRVQQAVLAPSPSVSQNLPFVSLSFQTGLSHQALTDSVLKMPWHFSFSEILTQPTLGRLLLLGFLLMPLC